MHIPGGESSGGEPSHMHTPGGESSRGEPSHMHMPGGESSGGEPFHVHTPGGELSGGEPSHVHTPEELSGGEPSHIHTPGELSGGEPSHIHTPVGETTSSPVGEFFTPEQEEVFRKRVEEKYDIFIDKDYVRWLGIHHLDLLPGSGGSQTDTLVGFHFLSVTPLTPIMQDSHSGNSCLTSASGSYGSASSLRSSSTPTQSVSPTLTLLSSTPPSQMVVSKFLSCPVTTPGATPTCKSLPHARLLTSASSLVMLEGKERKNRNRLRNVKKETRKR